MKSLFHYPLLVLLLVSSVFVDAQINTTSVPVPVNDTIDIYPGITVNIDLFANDTIPAGDSLRLAIQGAKNISIIKGYRGNINITLTQFGNKGDIRLVYRIMDLTLMQLSDTGYLYLKVHDRSIAYLDVNNVRAMFSASGLHFFLDTAEYEVPKGSGKTSMFCTSAWLGGLDNSNQLHLVAERYRQGPNTNIYGTQHDYWAGPVSDPGAYNVYQDTIWNRIWKLNKSDIDYHRDNYWKPGYQPIRDILEWPAHGNAVLGQAANLAPYWDYNNNGIYDPMNGDYPEILGDQALFFIYNDDHGLHAETYGEKLKVEIHGLAYAFNRPNDTAFKNTVFLNLKVFNRSQNTYHKTWFGVFADIDLGYSNDDYEGCDPERGMFYAYNGTPVDGSGQSYAYGANPPAQAVVMLAGPKMDPDGYDNPAFKGSSLNGPSFSGSCDIVAQDSAVINMKYGPGEIYEAPFLVRSEAINGVGFGDGVVDNERMGMLRFLYTNNSNSGVPFYMFDPLYAPDYYKTLTGRWRDSTVMIYGGNGHPSAGGYGPLSHYMFPGLSDHCNWGTGGIEPNPKEWTEKTAHNNPNDRRGTMSSGPFTFHPGDMVEVDLAFAWARNYEPGDTTRSIPKLETVVDSLRSAFLHNHVPGGGSFNGLDEQFSRFEGNLAVFPNPANEFVFFKIPEMTGETYTIELFSSAGMLVKTSSGHAGGIQKLDLTGLPSGFYILKSISKSGCRIAKLLKKF